MATMAPKIALLRGINLGSTNRIGMPALREALQQAGFDDVRTYVQSGNIVLRTTVKPTTVASRCRKVIAETFDLDIPVIVRTRDELADVVKRNPLGAVADNPKRYQVCFLEKELESGVLEKLEAVAGGTERIVSVGRELYTWHPEGVARSKLWSRVAGPSLGVESTSRNWTTVETLLAMADE
jgi:uncharacterized protein (DUF1697 family)